MDRLLAGEGFCTPTETSSGSSTSQNYFDLSTGSSALQDLHSSSSGISTSQDLPASSSGAFSTRSVEPEVDIGIIDEYEDGIGYLSAHPVCASVKEPCHAHEGDNGVLVPLGTPERVGHTADVERSDCDGYSSVASVASEPGLTGSSSDDEGMV